MLNRYAQSLSQLYHVYIHMMCYTPRVSERHTDFRRCNLHYNTLQYTATHCNTLLHAYSLGSAHQRLQVRFAQNTATHYSTLQHSETHCNTPVALERRNDFLRCGLHCYTLQYTATLCGTLQHSAQHTAKHCNSSVASERHTDFWRCDLHCNTLQYTAAF